LVALYAPLAIACAWRRRSRASYEVLAALGFGVALQLVAVVMNSSATDAPSKATDVPELYIVRVTAGTVVGEHWAEEAWLRAGVAIPLLISLVLLAAVVVLALRTPRS